MATQETEVDLTAAFESGFDADEPTPEQPAPAVEAAAPAPGPDAAEATTEGAAGNDEQQPEDELAGLPPKVRAMLEELQSLRTAAAAVPTLERRLRTAEGRIGDLNSRAQALPPPPAPTPPAPPRLEKLERVREELPEVAEAMEELLQARLQAAAPAPAPAPAEPDATPTLDAEAPGWAQKVASPDFDSWLGRQPEDYRNKVKSTTSEAVMLAAVTRFDADQALDAERKKQAAKVTQTRQARAAAAVTPNGGGRRAPSELSPEAAFEAGFHGR